MISFIIKLAKPGVLKRADGLQCGPQNALLLFLWTTYYMKAFWELFIEKN